MSQGGAGRLLAAHKVATLCAARAAHQKLVLLSDEQTVAEALQVLASHHIMAAPVRALNGDILGFADVRDILLSFLAELEPIPSLAARPLMARIRTLEERGSAYCKEVLKGIKILGSDGDFLHGPSQAHASLLELCRKVFVEPRTTEYLNAKDGSEGVRPLGIVHRVGLFDKEGDVQSIISQSDIIRFLSQHTSHLGSTASMSLEALGLASKAVTSVRPSTSAIEALGLMADKGLSGLAVVGEAGELLANFSLSDFRALLPEHFGVLALPVAELLALEHHTEYAKFNRHDAPPTTVHQMRESEGLQDDDVHHHRSLAQRFAALRSSARGKKQGQGHVAEEQISGAAGQQLVVCTPASTLGEVIGLLAGHHLHRVYCITKAEQQHRVCGVVTCTDVIRCIIASG